MFHKKCIFQSPGGDEIRYKLQKDIIAQEDHNVQEENTIRSHAIL